MRVPRLASIGLAALLAFGAGSAAHAAEVLLQNDGFVDGQPVGFQGGFVAGEIAAVRLVPSGTGPWQVKRVQFLYGGAATTRTITLHIWDDAAGTDTPGTEVFFGDYQVTGDNTVLQEIDLAANNVVVSAQFRVGIEFQDDGYPSVARDGDGTITSTRNFIYTPSVPGWFRSSLFGLTGDWIIRAVVDAAPSGIPGAASILSIADVGNDQGRQVRVRFSRSNQDQAGATTPIDHYEVHRRVDPGLLVFDGRGALPSAVALDGWDYVASVPAHGDSIYGVVVPTLADSSIAGGQHWSAFFIRAATAAPLVFFDSPADSGYSVDNLPPAPPAAFAASRSGGVTTLQWSPNAEPDLWYYRLHRGATAEFVPGPGNLIATSSEPGFEDGGPAGAYYKLAAVDASGNVSAFVSATSGTTGVTGGDGLALSIAIAGPNPTRGARLPLSLELPRAGRAWVEVLDVGGRRVARRDLGPLGPGRHALDLLLPGAPVAGVYFVRLGHDAGERVVRAAVLP